MAELKLRKSKPKAKTNELNKKVKQNIASLDEYSSTKALNSSLMNTVKTLYKTRDITNIRTAKSALDLLASNNKSYLNKISKKLPTIMNQTTKKTTKQQVKRKAVALKEEEEEHKLIKVMERKIFKPKVNIKMARQKPQALKSNSLKNIVYLLKPLMQDIRGLLDWLKTT